MGEGEEGREGLGVIAVGAHVLGYQSIEVATQPGRVRVKRAAKSGAG